MMWGKDRRGLESALHIAQQLVVKRSYGQTAANPNPLQKWKRKSKIVQFMETGMLILAGLMQAGREGKWSGRGKGKGREGGKGREER